MEHGTDHLRLGKQYVYDIIYANKFVISNYFRWQKVLDTSELNILPLSAFVEQKISWVDSSGLLKDISIRKMYTETDLFVGRYIETHRPVDTSNYYIHPITFYQSYLFKIPLQRIAFDESKRFMLRGIIKIEE
jgi:hypothetical protein